MMSVLNYVLTADFNLKVTVNMFQIKESSQKNSFKLVNHKNKTSSSLLGIIRI